MNTRLLTLFLFLAPLMTFAEDAEVINRIKWEESKEHGTWQGKIGDDWVVSASSRNASGVNEIQMVTCPGTDKIITVSAERDEASKKFRHTISVPKNFPFQVQIAPSKKAGGIVVTITFKKDSFWILFTDPDRNLIGINHFP